MRRQPIQNCMALGLVCAIAATSCGGGGGEAGPDGGTDVADNGLGLSAAVSCEPCRYTDSIEFRVVAENDSADDVTILVDDANEPILIFKIRRAGEETGTDLFSSITVGLGGQGDSLTLRPNQEWVKRFTWNQQLLAQDGSTMVQAETGNYEVEATAFLVNAGENLNPVPVVVSTTFAYSAPETP